MPSKQRESCQPFSICTQLCVLLATAANLHCSDCEVDTCVISKPETLTPKQRKAKTRELQRALDTQSKLSCFRIGSIRTAKHKKHVQHISAKQAKLKTFVADSGATVTVVSDINLLHSIEHWDPGIKVKVASKHTVQVKAIGTVQLVMQQQDGTPYTVLHENVHYSPDFSSNLLSIDEMHRQHKFVTIFRGKRASFITPDGAQIDIQQDHRNRQYQLFARSVQIDDPTLWHRRFMHAGNAAMRRMGCHIPCLQKSDFDFTKCDACLQGGGRKIPLHYSSRRPRTKDPNGDKHVFTYFGERVASDLCGPFPDGPNGEKYAIVFHDSYSKYITVYVLKNKERDTVLDAFKKFMEEHEDVLSRGIGKFWTDNGGEYQNADMDEFCDELCIRRGFSIPYEPRFNPYSERSWGSVLRPTRTALAESEAPSRFWTYCIEQAALVHNILCDDHCMSPYERVYGKPYEYNKLHTILSLCYYLLPERDRKSKLSPRSMPAYYLGEDKLRNGHMVYVPGLNRTTSSFHLVFNEHRYYNSVNDRRVRFQHDVDPQMDPIGNTQRHYTEDRDFEESDKEQPVRLRDDIRDGPANDARHGTETNWNERHCEDSQCLLPRGHDGQHDYERPEHRLRDLRRQNYAEQVRKLYPECKNENCAFHADHYGKCEGKTDGRQLPNQLIANMLDSDSVFEHDPMETSFNVIIDDVAHEVVRVNSSDMADVPCPKQYKDTQQSPLKDRWNESMVEEFTSLVKNRTWIERSRFDKLLKGRKPTKSRWVYTIKYNRDGTIERFKSRFVVCGYSQRQGVDYDRAFSATLRSTSFRTLLAIAAGQKMRLMQFDVKNAFTQAYMDDVDMFVEPAEGFETYETIRGKKYSLVYHLQRALYGTKQASRLWQETLRKFLLGVGFRQSTSDPCLYHLQTKSGGRIILGIYVDDIVLAYNGEDTFNNFSAQFNKRFPDSKSGPLKWFLGMAIDQHADFSIHLDHTLSIEKMAAKYIPDNHVTREFLSPDLFNKLSKPKDDIERAKAKAFPYASLVGALLYISVMSRPDTAFHTSMLAKFLSDPSEDGIKAAIQLMQYLHSTRNRKMYFSGKVEIPDGLSAHAEDINRNMGFHAYSDSSWGNAIPYPMFGYGIYLYGSLISYASKQLKTVAFSSCEAEYAAGAFACKEIEFVRNICDDMGVTLQGRLIIALDNTAAIDVARDTGVSGRTKHFDRAIHYIRDLTTLRRVLPVFVKTGLQRADGYTKALDKSTFTTWLKTIFHSL